MKIKCKLLYEILICSLVLSLCGCTTKKEEEYIYICTTSQGGAVEEFDGGVDLYEYGLYMMGEPLELNDVDKCKSLPLGEGGEYKYEYTEWGRKAKNSEEYGDFYCIYDRYYSDNGSTSIYLHGTDQLALFSWQEGDTVIFQGEGDGKEIAEQFIKELLSEEMLEKYTYDGHHYYDDFEEDEYKYIRYIEGYETDEIIRVEVKTNGIVSCYHGFNVGKYDTLEEKLTKEELDTAKENLLNKLYETFGEVEHEEPRIITNTSGDVFMEVRYSYESCGYIMVISVN